MMTKEQVSWRLDPELLKRLRAVTTESKKPYPPTQTKVVERGIELALKELEKRK